MPYTRINGTYINVDIAYELAEYEWINARWSSDKLLAASPFRYDQHPSFFVNLDGPYAGTWGDSGAYDTDYESGNLPKLLAFMNDQTYEEACEYLVSIYGQPSISHHGQVQIKGVHLTDNTRTRRTLNESELTEYAYRHPYLARRGIGENVQRYAGIGYSKQARAITIPWRHIDGQLANVKYRKVQGKAFWYRRDGEPVRNLVYGIDKIHDRGVKTVYICESEIDALSFWQVGQPSVALGGTSVTRGHLDKLRRSPIETIIIARDNDKPGSKMERSLRRGLVGYMDVQKIDIPAQYKDANDALVDGVDLASLPAKRSYELFSKNFQ